MKINFTKYSAHGNDFVLIDKRITQIDMSPEYVQKICSRHFGIGADGVILIDNAKGNHDFLMTIYNSDGSLPSMCGNATRVCVAYHYNITNNKQCSFETANSIYSGQFEDGEAVVKMSEVYDVGAIDISDLAHLGGMYLNTGVPHSVIETKNIESLDLVPRGLAIGHDERFKDGTNVSFFEVVKSKEIKYRVFERGVEAETMCCGTGIVAAAITCKELFNWSGEILVHCLGGEVKVNLNEDLSEIYYKGKVDLCFEGTINL